MANPSNWQKRRWKIVERAIKTDAKLNNLIAEAISGSKDEHICISKVAVLFAGIGLPTEAARAAVYSVLNMYSAHDIDSKDTIISMIESPIVISDKNGSRPIPINYFNVYLVENENNNNLDTLQYFEKWSDAIIFIRNDVTLADFIEIIKDNWEDIQSVVKNNNIHKDAIPITSKRIYPLRTDNDRKRDAIIFKCRKEGKNYRQIAMVLKEKGYGDMSEESIRQRYSRVNKKLQERDKDKNTSSSPRLPDVKLR